MSNLNPYEYLTVPTGWSCKRLEECTQDGNISYGIVQPGQHTETGIPVIRINNVNNGQLDLKDVLKVSPEIERKYERTRLKGGEVLLTLVGSTGQSFVAPKELAGWNVPRAIAVIRADDEIGADWINICLQTEAVKHFLNVRANTTVQKTLNLKDVRDIPILIPPKDVKRTVENIALGLSQKIHLNTQTNQTLESIAQAIFKSWFVDFEPVKAKMAALEALTPTLSQREREQKVLLAAMGAISGKNEIELAQMQKENFEHYSQLAETAALFPSAMVESELGEIPEGWEVQNYSNLCKKIESGGTPKRNEDSYWNGEVSWLSSGEVRDKVVINTKEKITIEGLKNSSAKLWPKNTTVIAMYGATAGEACLLAEEMCANQACCGLIPKTEFASFVYLSAIRSSQLLAEKASGSAQQNLNKGIIENHSLIAPPSNLAKQFEWTIQNMILKLIENYRENINLAQLRDSLLPKLLSGEIDLSESALTLALSRGERELEGANA